MTEPNSEHMSTFSGSVWELVAYLCRLLLGVVFISAGLPKFAHPSHFLEAVFAYDLVGPILGVLLASTLPAVEVVVGFCLVLGFYSRAALLCSSVLLIFFGIAWGTVVARGLEISCGCFPLRSGSPNSVNHSLEIIVLVSISLALLFRESRRGWAREASVVSSLS